MNGEDVSPAAPENAPTFDLSQLPSDVAEHVAGLLVATRALAAVTAGDLDGAAAAVVAAALASVTSRLGVVGARMLPVVEADGLWALAGARSFPRWVAARHRVSARTAHAQVRLGRALRDHLPATTEAGAAGDITLEHAQLIARLGPTTELRREALAAPDGECNERFLVEQARLWPVDSFTVLARRWAAAADPDADDRGYREAADREHFTMSPMPDGYHLTGLLTLEHGQYLKTALEAVAPVPAAGDERTSAQRRAQALGDVARVVLDNGLAPKRSGVRPRLNVLVPYDVLAAAAAAAGSAAADAGAREVGPGGGERTAGTDGTFSTAAVSGESPITGPQFEDGTPAPRALLRRLLCDSEIARFVFGSNSEILDVGRAERTFTRHLRSAIIARDKHCRFPGCAAPPVLSECHHVEQWARDRGETSVRNGILLCWFHHDLVHRRDIDIRRDGAHWLFTDRDGGRIDVDLDVPYPRRL